MDTKCLVRKRIWEVDCWSLDAALAASFDWRELINMLQSRGHGFNFKASESVLEIQAQCLIHEYCHSENELSVRIEALLDGWHQKWIDAISGWLPAEVAEYALTVPLHRQLSSGGFFWALGGDAREGFDCIRRKFHQRFQISVIRKNKN